MRLSLHYKLAKENSIFLEKGQRRETVLRLITTAKTVSQGIPKADLRYGWVVGASFFSIEA